MTYDECTRRFKTQTSSGARTDINIDIMKHDYDLLVIGSGSAGFSAASAAKGTGRKIGVVEAERLGGECPNWACVPTKVLLKSAKLYRDLVKTADYGVTHKSASISFEEVMKRRGKIVGALGGPRIEKIADKLGFDILRGFATFLDEHTLEIDGKQVTSAKFVIATGAGTFVPPIPGLDTTPWIGFKEAVTLSEKPASMIVIGGGPVGCELATFYASVGTDVTLLQAAPMVLHREEPEVAEVARAGLEAMGMKVYTGVEVVKTEDVDGEVQVKVRVGKQMKTFTAEKLLLATGKRANTAGLGCKAAGVKLDQRGNIVTNSELRTTAKHIWAAGDVDGGMQFTHTAHYEGHIAGHNAFSKTATRVDERVVPRVTFTDPEIASVGMTEAQVREKYGKALVGSFPMRGLGRAYIDGHTEGLVKIVADPKTRKVLGGHVAGQSAGEVMHEIALAMYLKAKIDDLAAMIHAYPTYSEGVTGAAAMAVVS